VSRGRGKRVELLFLFSSKTKNSRPQPYIQTKGKKKSAQKLYLLPFISLVFDHFSLYFVPFYQIFLTLKLLGVLPAFLKL
jgi:hypothetical protein